MKCPRKMAYARRESTNGAAIYYMWLAASAALAGLHVGTVVTDADGKMTYIPQERIFSGAPLSQVRDVTLDIGLEELERFRRTFQPSITELSQIFGVSRQTIYNWLSGRPIAMDNLERFASLRSAVDYLERSVGKLPSGSVRRSLAGGKSFIQLVSAGENPLAAAEKLAKLINREMAQASKIRSRFAPSSTAGFDATDIGGGPYIRES